MLCIMSLPNLCYAFWGADFIQAPPLKQGLYLSLCFFILCLPLILLKPKQFYYLLYILWPISCIELICISLYQTPSNPGVLISIFNTNINEAKDFLSLYKASFITLIIIPIFFAYFHIQHISQNPTPTRIKKIILYGFLLANSTLWIRDIYLNRQFNSTSHLLEIIKNGTYTFQNKYLKIFPISSFLQIYKTLDIHNKNLEYQHHIQSFSFHAKGPILQDRQVYIVVLGESARSQNFQINGYEQPTTPRLSQDTSIISLRQVYSQASLTALSIPMLLTRAQADHFEIQNHEKTFISAFKEAGFKTYWISNQSLINSDFSKFNHDIDELTDLNSDINSENYDENIFSPLERILQKKEPKQLILIHLMGSHFNYKNRYPEKFNHFQPSIQQNFSYNEINPKNKNILINSYNNSILYTDFILDSIIKSLKQQECLSWMNYISDHGENLYDDQVSFGHGNLNPREFEIKVPWIIWYSKNYLIKFPYKYLSLKSLTHQNISNNSFFHTILDQGLIYTHRLNPKLILTSPTYQATDTFLFLRPDFTPMTIKRP